MFAFTWTKCLHGHFTFCHPLKKQFGIRYIWKKKKSFYFKLDQKFTGSAVQMKDVTSFNFGDFCVCCVFVWEVSAFSCVSTEQNLNSSLTSSDVLPEITENWFPPHIHFKCPELLVEMQPVCVGLPVVALLHRAVCKYILWNKFVTDSQSCFSHFFMFGPLQNRQQYHCVSWIL